MKHQVIKIDDVPSAVQPPTDARNSAVRRAMVHHVFGRRSFIRGLFAGGVAVGLWALDLLPTGPRASALPETWLHCGSYSDWDNGYWNICNPCAMGFPPRDNYYCNDDGYHRIDTVYEGEGTTVEYSRRLDTCKNRNAWVWHISDNDDNPNPHDRRCSDGRYRRERYGELLSKGPTVCMKWLSPTGTVYDNRTVSC